jgi:hypothetical protein
MNKERVERICLADIYTIQQHAHSLLNIAQRLGVQAENPVDLCARLSEGQLSAFYREYLGVSQEAFFEAFQVTLRALIVTYTSTLVGSFLGEQAATAIQTALLNATTYINYIKMFMAFLSQTEPDVNTKLFRFWYSVLDKITIPGTELLSDAMRKHELGQISREMSALFGSAGVGTVMRFTNPGKVTPEDFSEATLKMMKVQVAQTGNSVSKATMGLLNIPTVLSGSPIGRVLLLFKIGDPLFGMLKLVQMVFGVITGASEVSASSLLAQLLQGAKQIIMSTLSHSWYSIRTRGYQFILDSLARLASAGLPWAGPMFWAIYVISNVVIKVSLKVARNVIQGGKRRGYLYSLNLEGAPRPHPSPHQTIYAHTPPDAA